MPARREFSGNAVPTTITGNIGATSTSIVIADATGWPDGSGGKFYATLRRGTSSEERILVETRTGTTLNLASSADRGVDDTTATSHTAGDAIEHTSAAADFDEANTLTSLANAKGDIIAATAADTWARKAVGTNGYPLVANSAQSDGLEWAQLDTTGIADDAVTTAKIADSNVTTAKIADDAVTLAKLAVLPAVRVRRSTNQTINSGAEAVISFDTEMTDTDTMWVVGSPTRITFTTAGVYVVTGALRLQGSPGDSDRVCFAKLRLNGTDIIARSEGDPGSDASGNLIFSASVSTVRAFSAADYVELTVYHEFGTARNATATGELPNLAAAFLTPAS